MKTVELKINDDFYDELVKILPKNRASIVDDAFLKHQKFLHEELENYKNSNMAYRLYSSYIEKSNKWAR